jgi:SAM-dependent methyltransferase
MTSPARVVLDDVLWRARETAFPAGEFVGQESFMTAAEIRSLAARAGIRPGVSVLDLCCGVGGAGLFVTRELGCRYLGVDASASAVAEAGLRARDAGIAARFEVARMPRVPSGPFDVVLLLETLLAFRDKPGLLRQVAAALPLGGRFAFTVEEGVPLSAAERAVMPAPDTVWLTPLPRLLADLEDSGLAVFCLVDCSRAHRVTVDALVEAYAALGPDLDPVTGGGILDDLLRSHRLWSRWLRDGRARKFAVVAQKVAA